MKGSLKPTFAKYIGGNYIIWFEKTNQYVIASDFLYHLITIFLNSENITEFKRHNKSTFDEAQARLTYKELSSFLYEANSLQVESIPNEKFSDTKLDLTPVSNYYYYIGEKSLNLRFSDDPIFNLIKERLSQFKVHKANENLICFDFKISNGIAYLEKQGQLIAKYPYSKMHYLFGKFSMELISNLYSFPTTSWLATLHASTVCDENQAIMLVGESGNGKSTLAGLCLLNGLSLLADDFTPLSSKSLKLYKNPSAISIKEGAFNQFKNIPDNLRISEAKINPKKQIAVRYLQEKAIDLTTPSRRCNKIVYVQYSKTEGQYLKSVSSDKILKSLIPDSWISPKKEHAESFLNWIGECQFYELIYHENKFAIEKIKTLFKNNHIVD